MRALKDIREVVLASIADIHLRKQLFEEFSQPEWLERIRTLGIDEANQAMLARVHELRNPFLYP